VTGWTRIPRAAGLAVLVAGLSALSGLTGCSALGGATAVPVALHLLGGAAMVRGDDGPVGGGDAARTAAAGTLAPLAAPSVDAPTLVVDPPRAAAGFDSRRILYVRQAHRLDHFARNEWVDTPARMLAPLIVAAVARGGGFRAVVAAPSLAVGDLRLSTELLWLAQDFEPSPSRVRLVIRATIVDAATRRVVASREFDDNAAADSDDPGGGVVAANQAARAVIDRLAGFCAAVGERWQRDRPAAPGAAPLAAGP
jgi:cholesterol transport system auxiliary component